MSKALRIPDYLEHMNVAIQRIAEYVHGMDESAFAANPMAQDAVIRNLEILGEAAGNIWRVDPSSAERYPDFPFAALSECETPCLTAILT